MTAGAAMTLMLCLVVLAVPAGLYGLTRQPGESPRRWFGRYEPLDWNVLRDEVLASRWIRPGWWLRFVFGVIVVTMVIPWAMAAFVLISGDWRLPGTALGLVQLWFELTLALTIPLFLRILHWRKDGPVTLSWPLVVRWPQMLLYALAALQVYGVVIDAPQMPGLRALILWRWL